MYIYVYINICIYMYIYMYVCVCVCVCIGERQDLIMRIMMSAQRFAGVCVEREDGGGGGGGEREIDAVGPAL